MATIASGHVEALRQAVHGRVLLPADDGYDLARTVWNATVDRHPAIIVQCSGTTDVVHAINFARDQGLVLAIRGGGHNIAGSAICEGGLVIDMSRLRVVTVEESDRVAWVCPGATLADFDHEAQGSGLATPVGINSTTGIAGLTLGGGFGWLTRKYGMTVDNLLGAMMVTADGKRHWTSASEEPDLFWAIRGGGGNFGVATLFQFQLHPVGPLVHAGLMVFPAAQARSVLQQYRVFTETMPLDLNVMAVLRKAPPLPFLPASAHGSDVLILPIMHLGDAAQVQQDIAPIRAFGEAIGEHIGPMPYTAWEQAFDPMLGPGARNYWKSHNLSRLDDGVIDAIIAAAANVPSPLADIFLGHIGGVANRVSPSATAYCHRDARWAMNVHSRWERADEDARCIAWARDLFHATAPFASAGVYVNFLTEDEPARIGDAYGSNYARLAQIKQRYDPHNLFRANQNIAPTP